MKISGTANLSAPPEQVWQALNDPAVLVRTIPGCEQLKEVAADRYRMTITAGVASIKGTYDGEVALLEQNPPGAFTLHASGAGAPGTVQAEVKVNLIPDGAGTRLDYDADAVVGGMVGGVGQRMLTGVAKKTAGEFFSAVDGVLTGAAPEAVPVGAGVGPGVAPAPGAPALGAAASPRVFSAPPKPPSARGAPEALPLLAAFGAGAFWSLAGVVIGYVLARRAART